MKLIPAIDLRGGRCVRLFKGDFARETDYGSDALTRAAAYGNLGCDTLHVVDLDGARDGNQANRSVIRQVVESSGLGIQLGGGIRNRQLVEEWLDLGVQRCVIGSLAIEDPAAIDGYLEAYGVERIVVALDIRLDADGVPRPATRGWQKDSTVPLWDWLDRFFAVGLRHLLCTDIDRDGTLGGPNLDLYGDILRRFPGIALQASGGIRNVADLQALRALGVPAAISGRALLDGTLQARELRLFQRGA